MTMFIYFINYLHAFKENSPVIFTEKETTDYQLTATPTKTLRLQKIPFTTTYSQLEDNIAHIEPVKKDKYRIRFGENKYMFKKKKEYGVVAINLDNPIVKTYGEQGFLWKLKPQKNDIYVFENDGRCLTKAGKLSDGNAFYLHSKPCKKNDNLQEFRVYDVTIKKVKAEDTPTVPPPEEEKIQDSTPAINKNTEDISPSAKESKPDLSEEIRDDKEKDEKNINLNIFVSGKNSHHSKKRHNRIKVDEADLDGIPLVLN